MEQINQGLVICEEYETSYL